MFGSPNILGKRFFSVLPVQRQFEQVYPVSKQRCSPCCRGTLKVHLKYTTAAQACSEVYSAIVPTARTPNCTPRCTPTARGTVYPYSAARVVEPEQRAPPFASTRTPWGQFATCCSTRLSAPPPPRSPCLLDPTGAMNSRCSLAHRHSLASKACFVSP